MDELVCGVGEDAVGDGPCRRGMGRYGVAERSSRGIGPRVE